MPGKEAFHITRRVFKLLAPFWLLLAPGWGAPAEPNFFLKDGDRVVFYGDSITDQRLYTSFVETYVMTRFPQMKVTFINSGVSGDRVTGGQAGSIYVRLQRDVFAYQPTVMTIMLGMNDGGYHAFDQESFDVYAGGYRHIIQMVKQSVPGIRLTLIRPSPYDDVTRPVTFTGGYNKVLTRYGEFIEELGQREGLTVADLNTPMVAALEAANSVNAEAAKKIVPDRVHPSPGGHLLMAEALLKAWKAPAMVTAVEIDVAAKRAVRADNTQVTDLETGDRIAWTQVDGALPMPLDSDDESMAVALRASDFVEALDQEPLKITGLTAARYTLKIDGGGQGSFTKQQLTEGVNLATISTPMAKQAAVVHDLTLRHGGVHFARWRLVQLNLRNIQAAHTQAASDALDALEQEVIQQQREAAHPKPHHYELVAE
jgi:lysophospholipase L1-like esterase